ncbi:hypothetical protein U0070_007626, partial [Myodes glareolus]
RSPTARRRPPELSRGSQAGMRDCPVASGGSLCKIGRGVRAARTRRPHKLQSWDAGVRGSVLKLTSLTIIGMAQPLLPDPRVGSSQQATERRPQTLHSTAKSCLENTSHR